MNVNDLLIEEINFLNAMHFLPYCSKLKNENVMVSIAKFIVNFQKKYRKHRLKSDTGYVLISKLNKANFTYNKFAKICSHTAFENFSY